MRSQSNSKCEKCGSELRVSDWPFCPHGLANGRDAQVAAPTVVFKNAKGEYKFPGRDTDRPPKGFQRVELRSQRQRDAFEREVGAKETKKLRDVLYGREEAWKYTFAAHREKLLEIRKNSSSPITRGFVDACWRDAEKRAARGIGREESGFMIETNHIDASNRMPWTDKDTGWKDRR